MVYQTTNKNIINSKKQAGASLIGMLFVGGAVVFVALMVMKIFPAYQEYFSVKTIIHTMNKESLKGMTKNEIIDNFNKRADIGYVTVIHGSDLTIDKNSDGETVVSAEYQVVKPLFGNVSLLIDFATPSDRK